MPGYVIHLAAAKEYVRNHRVKDEEEFFKGTIAPDLLAEDGNIEKTHYIPDGESQMNFKKFLKENKINSSYMEGFFFHLVVDYVFYNQYFINNENSLYDDYDILNKELIEKYDIKLPEEVKEYVHFKEGTLKYLDKELVDKMITEVSRKSIDEYKKEAKQTDKVTTNLVDNKIIKLSYNRTQKIILAVAIIIMCLVSFIFMTQKEGYHSDEIFSYGSSNSEFENIFWSYRIKTPMHYLLEEKIINDGNIIDWIKRIKYYFIDHVDEKDEYISKKIEEEKIDWKTRDEAENYVKAKENRFNYLSVYYNQVQDVHPPLFYVLVHTVSSIFNNTFSKYMIFFINIPFFIGTCILIWKIMNLIRKKINFTITCNSLWVKHWWNINHDVLKNVYDANIFLYIIFIYKFKNSKRFICYFKTESHLITGNTNIRFFNTVLFCNLCNTCFYNNDDIIH